MIVTTWPIFNVPDISAVLAHSQFAQGGLLLMIIGALGAYARKLPSNLWSWFLHQTTMSVSILGTDYMYIWVKAWASQKDYTRRVRSFDAFGESTGDRYWCYLRPGPGRHWCLYKGYPLLMYFEREKPQGTTQFTETITLRTFGRSRTRLDVLTEEIIAAYQTHLKVFNEESHLFTWETTEWSESSFEPRPLESVLLPASIKQSIVSDITLFLESKDWYQHMGIPYHRGYLLHGPPGTGKSSFISGLSSHFKFSVYLLKLNSLNDLSLMQAVRRIKSGSMVVFEDIDCVTTSRVQPDISVHSRPETKDKTAGIPVGHVSLSGLLNALDGIESSTGVIYVMTTNHKDRLDPALIRPGRIDIQVELSAATWDQRLELYQRFFPEDSEESTLGYISERNNLTMAELQEALLQERNDRLFPSSVGSALKSIPPATDLYDLEFSERVPASVL